MPRRSQHSRQEEIPLAEPAPSWRANGIFTDHTIRETLRASDLWPSPERTEAVRSFCADIWNRRYVGLAQASEAVTRQELIDKVLAKLGFAFLPGTKLPSRAKRQTPDYFLYPDESALSDVFERGLSDPYSPAVALVEAKKVNHPLDAVSTRETQGRFPHQQVRDYLQYAQDPVSKRLYFNWAMLTNGNLWRLYCRNATPDDYFEFNFEKSLGSAEDFAVFVALFSPAAFIFVTERRCPLDDLREDALADQRKLEDNLRERVFNILENLANGFYARVENHISEDQLPDLYENCLILLYRLLFVLYAEGRGLLPVRPFPKAGSNRLYREHFSLRRLIPRLRDAARCFYDDDVTRLYVEILDLFRLINGDDPSLNQKCDVPLYDGGLFKPNEHPELRQWRVGDKTLAEALCGLMFGLPPSRKSESSKFDFGETIDYAELEVRQLGSIYEGLLENHLEHRDGRLVLVGDKAERKATGTYYTPDFVVSYIVEHTLGPLCQRIEESAAVQEALKQKEVRKDNSFANAVLGMKVLDPAMGSGHFLVRATEYLADKILNHHTTDIPRIEVLRGLSQAEAVRSYWRRRVVERCIFGVDLNPLAVELSKLSLWLTCIATDQPLSFLDHHLRVGNSLVGAKLSDLVSLPRKKETPGLRIWTAPNLPAAVNQALAALARIEETESKDLKALRQKEAGWTNDVLPKLAPYRNVADLWESTLFGLSLDDAQYANLAELLVAAEKCHPQTVKHSRPQFRSHLEAAEKLRKKHGFFHWEVEFPEVFFGAEGKPKSDPGFDAVIGNPPYVRPHKMSAEIKEVLWFSQETFVAKSDMYSCFMEKGLKAAKPTGMVSFIVPVTWTSLESFTKLRQFFVRNAHVVKLVQLPKKVFKDATVETCVFVVRRSRPGERLARRPVTIERVAANTTPLTVREFEQGEMEHAHLHNFHLMGRPENSGVLARVAGVGKPLSKFVKFLYGFKTGDDEKFISGSRRTNLDMPFVRSADVRRYSCDKPTEYVTYDPEAMTHHKATARPGDTRRFESEKLVVARMGKALVVHYDAGGLYVKDAMLLLPKDRRYSLKYLLGLLNSKLLNFYYREFFVTIDVLKNALLSMPIRAIDFMNNDDRAQHDRMVGLTEQMLKLHTGLQEAWADSDKDAILRDIEATDKEIDALVYELYGLTDSDIATIEAPRS